LSLASTGISIFMANDGSDDDDADDDDKENSDHVTVTSSSARRQLRLDGNPCIISIVTYRLYQQQHPHSAKFATSPVRAVSK